MKTLQVELPDEIAREVEAAVRSGVFHDAAEVVRAALREFISTRRFELQEQQQLQDIAWALREDSNSAGRGRIASGKLGTFFALAFPARPG
jgi:Arc/MetJ-type ribon-helix-helix transcriptional regulator